jgi:antitoxin component YwqK of YwqJK toxin-antitoxin module
MKNIKSILVMAAFLIVSVITAQDIKPNFETQGELIKGTFYYQDGSISQEGTYKDGKLHGQWISYDQSGKRNAVANYEDGKKTGKWFFWTPNELTEVDYNYNRIAEVNTYKLEETIVNKD